MSDQNDIDGMALAKEQRMDEHPDNWWFKLAGDTRPTPETDAHDAKVRAAGGFLFPGDIDFMRRLERERDAAYRTIQYLQKHYGT